MLMPLERIATFRSDSPSNQTRSSSPSEFTSKLHAFSPSGTISERETSTSSYTNSQGISVFQYLRRLSQ